MQSDFPTQFYLMHGYSACGKPIAHIFLESCYNYLLISKTIFFMCTCTINDPQQHHSSSIGFFRNIKIQFDIEGQRTQTTDMNKYEYSLSFVCILSSSNCQAKF